MNIQEIDITIFADNYDPNPPPAKHNGFRCRYGRTNARYEKASSGRRVVEETDLMNMIEQGHKVKFVNQKKSRDVLQPFCHAILKEILNRFGKDAIDQVCLDWYSGETQKSSFMRKISEKSRKNQDPIWSTERVLLIPQVGNQFMVQKDWTVKLYNFWYTRDMIKDLYGDVEFKRIGKEIPSNSLIDEAIISHGSTFLINDFEKRPKGNFDIQIIIEEGSSIAVPGHSLYVKKEFKYHPDISDFNKLVCSINELTKV
jgi:hypothetical protein